MDKQRLDLIPEYQRGENESHNSQTRDRKHAVMNVQTEWADG